MGAPLGWRTAARGLTARAVLGLVLIWPPAHLLLCLRYRFDSWRLSGWGMYATPPDVSLTLYFSARPSLPPDAMSASVSPGRQLGCMAMNVLGTSAQEFVSSQPGPFYEPGFANLCRSAHAWRQPSSIAKLAARAVEAHPTVARSAVVVITTPRVDPRRGESYATVDLFLYQDGRALSLGRYHSRQIDLPTLNLLIARYEAARDMVAPSPQATPSPTP